MVKEIENDKVNNKEDTFDEAATGQVTEIERLKVNYTMRMYCVHSFIRKKRIV